MTIFFGLAAAALIVLALGGDFAKLGEVEVRGKGAIIGAFALQLLIVTIAPLAFPHAVADAIHIGSYGLAIGFLILNRHLPWAWIAAVGGLCNFTAICANAGTMPASPTALAAAGIRVRHEKFVNSGAVAHARLAFLGDIFSFPKALPLANVFSIGDVILLIGATAMLAGICGCPRFSELVRSVKRRAESTV